MAGCQPADGSLGDSIMTHIVCPHCTTVNNIPAGRDPKAGTCGRCRQALFTGKPVDVKTEAFEQHLVRNTIPVVADFWAAWCGPCRVMGPVFSQAAAQLEPRVRFLKVDTEAEQQLSTRLGIRSIPTLILFDKGTEQAREMGALDLQTLIRWINQHL